jgi:hypothetical protein
MEATYEPEVCIVDMVVFRASKQEYEYATGCRHGVTPLADNAPTPI